MLYITLGERKFLSFQTCFTGVSLDKPTNVEYTNFVVWKGTLSLTGIQRQTINMGIGYDEGLTDYRRAGLFVHGMGIFARERGQLEMDLLPVRTYRKSLRDYLGPDQPCARRRCGTYADGHPDRFTLIRAQVNTRTCRTSGARMVGRDRDNRAMIFDTCERGAGPFPVGRVLLRKSPCREQKDQPCGNQ
jgi:hypothetical protein